MVAVNNKCLNKRPIVAEVRVIRQVYPFVSSIRWYSNIKLHDDYRNITSGTLNKVLANQGVSITQDELDRLKDIPGVKFDLPINDQTYRAFVGLVGRPNTRGLKSGVYFFTHKPSGGKYVGSSNSLSRRLDQYFKFKHINQDNSGQLLPFVKNNKNEGFDKFSLEIFVMPSEFSCYYSFLLLEQYYLLHESFNLNTQIIVNLIVNQGNPIYLYDLKGKYLVLFF